jgi:hypothetical protein
MWSLCGAKSHWKTAHINVISNSYVFCVSVTSNITLSDYLAATVADHNLTIQNVYRTSYVSRVTVTHHNLSTANCGKRKCPEGNQKDAIK